MGLTAQAWTLTLVRAASPLCVWPTAGTSQPLQPPPPGTRFPAGGYLPSCPCKQYRQLPRLIYGQESCELLWPLVLTRRSLVQDLLSPPFAQATTWTSQQPDVAT